MDRMLMMIVRQVMNRLIRTGVNKGVDAMAKRGGKTDPQAKLNGRKMARSARQLIRLGRRIGRF